MVLLKFLGAFVRSGILLIVLRFVRRVVSHADFQTVFENIPVGRMAAAASAKQEQRCRLRIMLAAVMPPAEGDAVASEFAGVVARAQIDVPVFALEIVFMTASRPIWVSTSCSPPRLPEKRRAEKVKKGS